MSRLNLAVPAQKQQLKARVAITGPSGSGKTYTALEWARVLAGDGTVLLVDTERRSSLLYADRFTFDALPWDPPYDLDDAGLTETLTLLAERLSPDAVVVIERATRSGAPTLPATRRQ